MVGVRVAERFQIVTGIHDANARSAESPFDTIDPGEFLKSVELWWIPADYERRRWDRARLQLWHQDTRDQVGAPSGQGVTFAVSRLINDSWLPFVLGGFSDGDASMFSAEVSAGIGRGFQMASFSARDVLGIGVSWGRPSDETLRDQYASELFFRLQLAQNLALTPSVQAVFHPAENPEEDSVIVFGLKGRLSI